MKEKYFLKTLSLFTPESESEFRLLAAAEMK